MESGARMETWEACITTGLGATDSRHAFPLRLVIKFQTMAQECRRLDFQATSECHLSKSAVHLHGVSNIIISARAMALSLARFFLFSPRTSYTLGAPSWSSVAPLTFSHQVLLLFSLIASRDSLVLSFPSLWQAFDFQVSLDGCLQTFSL